MSDNFNYPVTVTLYSGSPNHNTETVDTYIKYLQNLKESVPEKYRDKIQIDFSVDYDYGDSYANVEIYYRRDPTPQEIFDRKEKAKVQEALRYRSAKADYERLKKLFEGG